MIRAARREDAADLAALAVELGYENSVEDIAARLGDLLDRADHAVLVAVDSSRVTGWAHLRISHQLQSPDYAELTGLVVTERVRSMGIGGQLLNAAENWARTQGMDLLRLRSNVARTRAHHFYLERGYFELKQSRIFGKRLS